MTEVNESAANVVVAERRFFILELDKKNKNHRIYQKALGEKWVNSEKFKTGEGYDVEFAIPDGDYEYEYLKEEDNCGQVTGIFLEGNKLYGTAKFKIDGPHAEKLMDEEFLKTVCLVPKGKGAVKNQVIQDDYELYGFNLILLAESSFAEETPKEAVKAA